MTIPLHKDKRRRGPSWSYNDSKLNHLLKYVTDRRKAGNPPSWGDIFKTFQALAITDNENEALGMWIDQCEPLMVQKNGAIE